ncbi:tRNA-2-methylthio-N(6)-dimethylallyladenosine synthase [Trichinella pseudospiralis]
MSADKEQLGRHHSSKRKVSKRTALRNVVDYANYLQILYSCAEYKNTLNQVTSIVKNCEKQNKILEEKLIKQYNEIRSLYLKLKCVCDKMADMQNENKILSQLHASVEAAIERIKLITSFADETSLKMLNVNAMSLENIALSLKPLFESEDKISALEKSADCNLHCLTNLRKLWSSQKNTLLSKNLIQLFNI